MEEAERELAFAGDEFAAADKHLNYRQGAAICSRACRGVVLQGEENTKQDVKRKHGTLIKAWQQFHRVFIVNSSITVFQTGPWGAFGYVNHGEWDEMIQDV